MQQRPGQVTIPSVHVPWRIPYKSGKTIKLRSKIVQSFNNLKGIFVRMSFKENRFALLSVFVGYAWLFFLLEFTSFFYALSPPLMNSLGRFLALLVFILPLAGLSLALISFYKKEKSRWIALYGLMIALIHIIVIGAVFSQVPAILSGVFP